MVEKETHHLLGRWVTGEALVGVTVPPDFFARRVPKKADNAVSFARVASFGVVIFTKETPSFRKKTSKSNLTDGFGGFETGSTALS